MGVELNQAGGYDRSGNWITHDVDRIVWIENDVVRMIGVIAREPNAPIQFMQDGIPETIKKEVRRLATKRDKDLFDIERSKYTKEQSVGPIEETNE